MPAADREPSAFAAAVAAVRAGSPPEETASNLYERLDDGERLWLLDGDRDFWEGLRSMQAGGYNRVPYVHGAVERLGIPGTRFVDGPRGCVAGHGTCFPVSMARGATWDVDLEERVGNVIGREVRAQTGNFFGGVCINLPRHPAWGRAQETYGDDPHHLGEMGAALVRGVQRWAMACAKHYALNSMENARFTVDVTVDDAVLHDVYLPHFKRAADEGVAAVMGAYNSVNGEWCGQNTYLLTTVLRDLWAWDGITVTDFIWGMRDGAAALNAGMDLEEPLRQQRAQHLRHQIDEGESSWAMVERAGLRLLAAQLRSYAGRLPDDPAPDVMANEEARALARTVAARSIVLLKNEPVGGRPVLPLDPASLRSIAVIGRLASVANTGDHGSSDVHPPSVVTPLEGVKAALPDANVAVVEGDDLEAAAAAAASADVALVVVGYDAADEGEYIGPDVASRPELLATFPPIPDAEIEALTSAFASDSAGVSTGGDRASLTLRGSDEELVRVVVAANPRTVVAIVAAGAVLTESWRHEVPAVLMLVVRRHGRRPRPGRRAHGRPQPHGAAALLHPHLRGAPAAVRSQRHRGHLRPVPRAAAPRPARRDAGLPARVRPLLHDVRDRQRVRPPPEERRRRAGRDRRQHGGARRRPRRPDLRPCLVGTVRGGALLCGFAPVSVPAGTTAVVDVEVSLTALASWDPSLQTRVPPAAPDVVLEVGAHAHDPVAVTVPLANPA